LPAYPDSGNGSPKKTAVDFNQPPFFIWKLLGRRTELPGVVREEPVDRALAV